MFRGINSLNIDTKGRFALPTRYRDLVSDLSSGRLVMTIDTEERCLLIYPHNEWEVIEEKLSKLPSFNAGARRIQRLLVGHATEAELDGNGRILLPNLLREYAGLDKKIILLGQGKKFELWDEATWQQQREQWLGEEGDSDELPNEVLELSL